MSDHYLFFLNVSYSFAILRPLQEAIWRRGAKVAWFIHDLDPSLLKKNEYLLENISQVKNFNPKAVFVPGNWVPDFFPGVKVELFHGFGIEKKGHFDIRGLFDLYCTHGPLTTKPFKTLAARHKYFAVIETGWPKIDTLFNYQPDSSGIESLKNHKPVILFAPTFSPSLSSAPKLMKIIKELSLAGKYKWLVKFHPLMDENIVKQYHGLKGPNLKIIDDPDIIPSLRAADIMLSDTSSVVVEFLLLNKPVITFKTKKPGPYIKNIQHPDELAPALDQMITRPKEIMKHLKKFISQMHPYNDGCSSERVLAATDRFILDYRDHLKNKPLNLWRKIQIRRRLRYYGLA